LEIVGILCLLMHKGNQLIYLLPGLPWGSLPSATGPPNPCEGDSPGDWSWFPDGAVTYNLTTPNPAKDYIQFEYTGNDFLSPLQVHLSNMVGQTMVDYTITKMDLNEPFRVNTAILPNGIYYISIIQKGLKTTKKSTILR
jgi:hypothetical protein